MVSAPSMLSSGIFALCAATSWLAERFVQGEKWRLVRPTHCRMLYEVFLIGKKGNALKKTVHTAETPS